MDFIHSIAARFTEPSSWAGITTGLTAIGFSLPPGTAQSVTYLGAGIAGLLAFFIPESAKK